MLARPPRGDLGQGAGRGFVPRLEDAPEDFVRGGGVTYCPWWGGPWGEHGVGPFHEPLRAGGCCCGGHYVVVSALEHCTPDLRRGVFAVCRWGGEVIVGDAEGGVPGWCSDLFPLFRVVHVCWVVPLRWGSWQVCGPATCDVGVDVVCQGLTRLDGGDLDVLALGVFAGSPEDEVYYGLVEAFAWGG